MKDWWLALAPRERVLIGIAGTLTALILIWQFLIVPSVSARQSARQDMELAAQTLSQVQEAYMAKRARGTLSPASGAAAGLTGEAFKSAITELAANRGLSIVRLQGGGEAPVGLLFDQVDPRLFFVWLEEIETRLGGRVERLSLEQTGGGKVRANVEISTGGAS